MWAEPLRQYSRRHSAVVSVSARTAPVVATFFVASQLGLAIDSLPARPGV
jgi:hypothetical protein